MKSQELREQTIIVLHDMEIDIRARRPFYISTYAERINSLIPKPTVWLPCDKCGGSGATNKVGKMEVKQAGEPFTIKNCTCTDGKVEHLIIWTGPREYLDGVTSSRTLELLDLLIWEVAEAYGTLSRSIKPSVQMLYNNRGTLRIGPAVKEGV